jgi:hypothetical protein
MPPPILYRQSSPSEPSAMANRVDAKYLVLMHLIPPKITPGVVSGRPHSSNWEWIISADTGIVLPKLFLLADRGGRSPAHWA